MRSDMFKVIVERPRRNASGAGNGRPARALEDLPAEERKAHASEARRRILDDDRQLHLLKGVWYLVEVRLLPDGGPQWDVVRKKDVVRRSSAHLVCSAAPREQSLYGRADLYAVAKRQLSERELRRHGLK